MQPSATTLNLASIISHHARLTPTNEAVVWEDVRMTFGELDKWSNRIANALVEMGIGHGDKVALCCPNLPCFPVVYYAIMKVGAVVVPLNVLFKPREIAYHLSDSDAKAVFVFEDVDDLPMAQYVKEGFDQVSCRDLVVMTKDDETASPFSGYKILAQLTEGQRDDFEIFPTRPDDTCAILYTSGIQFDSGRKMPFPSHLMTRWIGWPRLQPSSIRTRSSWTTSPNPAGHRTNPIS